MLPYSRTGLIFFPVIDAHPPAHPMHGKPGLHVFHTLAEADKAAQITPAPESVPKVHEIVQVSA